MSLVLPTNCLSLANTALTSSSSDFLAGAGAAGSGSSFGAVVTEAGKSVAPCASIGTGFSLAAFCTSMSRSICEHSPSVTGSSGVRLVEFQCVRSRIAEMVDLVVPTSRMMALSFSSG